MLHGLHKVIHSSFISFIFLLLFFLLLLRLLLHSPPPSLLHASFYSCSFSIMRLLLIRVSCFILFFGPHESFMLCLQPSGANISTADLLSSVWVHLYIYGYIYFFIVADYPAYTLTDCLPGRSGVMKCNAGTGKCFVLFYFCLPLWHISIKAPSFNFQLSSV